MKKQVAVIFGGKSSEHEVSCHSVLNVIKGFSPEKCGIMGSISAAMCLGQYGVPEKITEEMRQEALSRVK